MADIRYSDSGRAGIQSSVITTTTTLTDLTKEVRVDTSGGVFTITLPNIERDYDKIVVVDVGGSLSTNNLTVSADGTDNIEGNASVILTTDYSINTFVADLANNRWISVLEAEAGTPVLLNRSKMHVSTGVATGAGDNDLTLDATDFNVGTNTLSGGNTVIGAAGDYLLLARAGNTVASNNTQTYIKVNGTKVARSVNSQASGGNVDTQGASTIVQLSVSDTVTIGIHTQGVDAVSAVAEDRPTLEVVQLPNFTVIDPVDIPATVSGITNGDTLIWSTLNNRLEPGPISALTLGTEQNTNFTATANTMELVDVSGGVVTVSPPAAPVAGDKFSVTDTRGNAATNSITIDFVTATQPLHAASDNYIVDQDQGFVRFQYIDATIGWVTDTESYAPSSGTAGLDEVLSVGQAMSAARTIDTAGFDLTVDNIATNSDVVGTVMGLTAANALVEMEHDTFRSVSGAADPIDGTTVAWHIGQLFTNTTSNEQFVATSASTDPDTAGTGSVWVSTAAATSGIDDVLGVGQALTANRTIDAAGFDIGIDNAGDFGIGTAAPLSNLHVENSGTVDLRINTTGWTGTSYYQFQTAASGLDVNLSLQRVENGDPTADIMRVVRHNASVGTGLNYRLELADGMISTRPEDGVVIGSDGTTTTATNPLHVVGRGFFEAFGQSGRFTMRRAQGTEAAPTQVTGGTTIAQLLFQGYNDIGSYQNGARINVVAEANVVSPASSTSIDFAVNDGTSLNTKFSINGDGSLTANDYGSGTMTGTATQFLAVDSSGNIIEEPAPSSSLNSGDDIGSGANFTIPDSIAFSNITGVSTTLPNIGTYLVTFGATARIITNAVGNELLWSQLALDGTKISGSGRRSLSALASSTVHGQISTTVLVTTTSVNQVVTPQVAMQNTGRTTGRTVFGSNANEDMYISYVQIS